MEIEAVYVDIEAVYVDIEAVNAMTDSRVKRIIY